MAFQLQTTRRALQLFIAACFAGSAVLVWRALVPPSAFEVSRREPPITQKVATKYANQTRDLDAFAEILERPLGEPLYDRPKPKPVPKEPRQETKPPKRIRRSTSELRLIGTMIEEGKSLAILADEDGSIQLARVGETVELSEGEAKIDKISLKEVTFSLEDESVILEVP